MFQGRIRLLGLASVLTASLFLPVFGVAGAVADSSAGGGNNQSGSTELPWVEGEILVALDTDVSRQNVPRAMGTQGYEPQTVVATDVEEGTKVVVLETPNNVTVEQAVAQAEKQPGVLWAQPNFIYTLNDQLPADDSEVSGADSLPASQGALNSPQGGATNDTYIDSQWHLEAYTAGVKAGVGAIQAWGTTKGSGVTVAVLDTGVKVDHEDLVDNLDPAMWDVVNDKKLNTDIDGHGTHVAGIIAAKYNNGIGVAGVSPEAKVLPINVFHKNTENKVVAETKDIVKAYQYIDGLKRQDIHVINMSLGSSRESDRIENYYDHALYAEIAAAREKGILTVVAAGNEGDATKNPRNPPTFPSDYNNVVSVIALNQNGTRANFSNWGLAKDISAPGVGIVSTWHQAVGQGQVYYAALDGTSMASPVVAGVAALAFAKNRSYNAKQVEDLLYASTNHLGEGASKNNDYGWGAVNAPQALNTMNSATLQVDTARSKTKYKTGDSFSPADTVIKLKTPDDKFSTDVDTQKQCTFSGTGFSTAGTKNIDASCLDKSVSFNVTVQADAGPVLSAPPKPVIAGAIVNGVTAEVTWDAVTGANGYQVKTYVFETNGGFKAEKTLEVGAVTTASIPLRPVLDTSDGTQLNVPGEYYRFTVAARNTSGLGKESAYSLPISALANDNKTTFYRDPIPPAKVNTPTVQNISNGVRVSWEKPKYSNITGYKVQASNGQEKTISDADTISIDFTAGLTAGSSYRFRVAAKNDEYTEGDGYGAFSDQSQSVKAGTVATQPPGGDPAPGGGAATGGGAPAPAPAPAPAKTPAPAQVGPVRPDPASLPKVFNPPHPSTLAPNLVKPVDQGADAVIRSVDRIYTSAYISLLPEFTAAQEAVIVAGQAPIDGTTAAPLAIARKAPLLYAEADDLGPVVMERINRGIKKITLVGAARISPATLEILKAKGVSVEVIQGANRFDTSALVADQIPNPSKVFVADGTGLADSMAASVAAGNGGGVVMLSRGNQAMEVTSNAIQAKNLPVVAVGGPASQAYQGAGQQIIGQSRYDTANKLAVAFAKPGAPVFITNGQSLVDAVPASVVASLRGGAMLYAAPGQNAAQGVQGVGMALGKVTYVGQ